MPANVYRVSDRLDYRRLFANLKRGPFTSLSRRIIMTNRALESSHSREGAWRREHATSAAWHRRAGHGNDVAGKRWASIRVIMGMGLSHTMSPGDAFGGGIGGGGIGVGGGVGGWGFGSWLPYYAMGVPSGVFTFVPPMLPMGPGGFVPMMAPQPLAVDRGPIAPPPPAGLLDPANGDRPANKAGQKPKAKDSTRAGQLVLMGDRLFRGNNIKKAEERYVQATRLDPMLGRASGRPGTGRPGPRAVC